MAKLDRTPRDSKPEILPDDPQPRRLNIPLTDSGPIDLASMRETTKDKLRSALTPPVLAALGVAAPAGSVSASMVDAISPLLVDGLYDTIGRLTRIGVMRMTGATETQSEPMLFTAQEKADLRDPTARVLAKYTGVWLTKYADEVALLAAFGSMTIAKIEAVKSRVEADAQRGREVKTLPSEISPK